MKITRVTEIDINTGKYKVVYINMDNVVTMQERTTSDDKGYQGPYTNISFVDGSYKNVEDNIRKILDSCKSEKQNPYQFR